MKTNRTRTHGEPTRSTACGALVLRSLSLGARSFMPSALLLAALPACGGSLPRTAPPPEYERYELPAWDAPTEPAAVDPFASGAAPNDSALSDFAPGDSEPRASEAEIAPIPEPPAAAEGPGPGPQPTEPPSLAPELPAKSPK